MQFSLDKLFVLLLVPRNSFDGHISKVFKLSTEYLTESASAQSVLLLATVSELGKQLDVAISPLLTLHLPAAYSFYFRPLLFFFMVMQHLGTFLSLSASAVSSSRLFITRSTALFDFDQQIECHLFAAAAIECCNARYAWDWL